MSWRRQPVFTVETRKGRASKRPAKRDTPTSTKPHAKPAKAPLGPIAREVAAALRTNRFPRHWFN